MFSPQWNLCWDTSRDIFSFTVLSKIELFIDKRFSWVLSLALFHMLDGSWSFIFNMINISPVSFQSFLLRCGAHPQISQDLSFISFFNQVHDETYKLIEPSGELSLWAYRTLTIFFPTASFYSMKALGEFLLYCTCTCI